MSHEHQAKRSQRVAVRSASIIVCIVVSESLSATVLFPFVYQMVGGFDGIDDTHIGFWAGVITSTFFLSQSITAFYWGRLSDQFGRKPTLVVGLLGGSIGILLLGFARSLPWAIVARTVSGLFNGNAAVSRTALGELAHNFRWDQGKTFSLFGLCSAIGYIMGPLIGGYLVRPTQHFPSGGNLGDTLQRFPYLLPCIVVACYNGLAMLLSLICLRETQNLRIDNAEYLPEPSTQEDQSPLPTANESDPLLNSQKADEGKTSKTFTRSALFCVLALGLLSIHAIVFDENFPIIASSPSPYGLNQTPSDIGLTLSVMGPIVLVAALSIFPLLNARYPALGILRITALLYVFVYISFSFLPDLVTHHIFHSKAGQTVILFLIMAIRYATNVIAYTGAGVVLNLQASPGNRGALMGAAQMAMSLGKAVGPTFGGMLWSWSLGNKLPAPFDFHFLYLVEALFAMMQLMASLGIRS